LEAVGWEAPVGRWEVNIGRCGEVVGTVVGSRKNRSRCGKVVGKVV